MEILDIVLRQIQGKQADGDKKIANIVELLTFLKPYKDDLTDFHKLASY